MSENEFSLLVWVCLEMLDVNFLYWEYYIVLCEYLGNMYDRYDEIYWFFGE